MIFFKLKCLKCLSAQNLWYFSLLFSTGYFLTHVHVKEKYFTSQSQLWKDHFWQRNSLRNCIKVISGECFSFNANVNASLKFLWGLIGLSGTQSRVHLGTQKALEGHSALRVLWHWSTWAIEPLYLADSTQMEYLFLQTCCSKERIKASIERDRYIVIGIETNDKNFSAPSKVSLNQNFLKYLGNPNNKSLVVIFFCKGYHSWTFFCYSGTPLQTYSRDLSKLSTCQIESVFNWDW